MKTIFIPVRDGEVSKSVLRSAVLPTLVAHGARVVLFVPLDRQGYYEKEFAGPSVVVRTIPEPTYPRIEEVFSSIFTNSLHTNSIHIKQDQRRASGGSWLAYVGKRFLWSLGKWHIVRRIWRLLYSFVPDRSFDVALKEETPSLVFAANLIANEDARLMKAARRFGVPSVGMPKGWDNLTIKTFLGVHPDTLLVQTELLKKDAERLDMPGDRIQVVGFPKFDVYADRSLIVPREEFFASLGLDPSKKMILYAGAGTDLAPNDEEILAQFVQSVASNDVGMPAQVLVRPHPKYPYRTDVLPPETSEGRRIWMLDRPGTVVGKTKGSFEFDDADIRRLVNSLAHCDLLIHTASTLGIEAAIFDKPVISIAFDGAQKLSPELSVARYYGYEHLSRVVATGGMRLAYTVVDLLEFTRIYLAHPSKDHDKRLRLVEENAFNIDGRAGERIADVLLKTCRI